MSDPAYIDNSAWLAGYAAHTNGQPIPWGDTSRRVGWLAARDEAAKHDQRPDLNDRDTVEEAWQAANNDWCE